MTLTAPPRLVEGNPGMSPQEKRQRVQQRWESLKANRRPFESRWRELEEQFPSGSLIEDESDPSSKSMDRNETVYDSSAQLAVVRCVAGIMSNATSPARQWHKNTLDDQEALEDIEVQRYLDEVTAIQRRALQKSNTYRVLPHIYREMVVFGTGAAIVLPDFNNVVHLHPLVTGTYWLGQDTKGRVNACYRQMWMTAAQMEERWPDNLPRDVQAQLKNNQRDSWHRVLHAIEPRTKRNVRSPLATDMPWSSTYVCQSSTDKEAGILEEGGFKRFPVLAPRWIREGDDTYGQSPCSNALPFVRQLQLQTLAEGKVIAREAEPPMQVPTALKNAEVNSEPNGLTYYDQTIPSGGVRRLIEQPSDVTWLRQSMLDVRAQVQQALFLDLFQMLAMAGVDTKMTATEVAQRVEEKMLMLGPVMQNLHDELLVPLLDLIYYHLLDGGALPPPPLALQGRDFQPEFLSVLYQAQKAVSVNAYERWLMIVGGTAQASGDVGVWDGVDLDYIVRDAGLNLGVPAKAIRSTDEVQEMRDARAKAQAAQAQQAMLNQMSGTAKNFAQAAAASPLAAGSSMDQLTGYTGA